MLYASSSPLALMSQSSSQRSPHRTVQLQRIGQLKRQQVLPDFLAVALPSCSPCGPAAAAAWTLSILLA